MLKVYRWLNREKFRYYTIIVHKDMLNDTVLTYSWGGCSSRRGNHKHLTVQTEEEVEEHISAMMKRRKSRGYELMRQ